MKLLLLTTFVATVCYVNAGKTARLLAAALNGGLMPGMNGGLMAGMNGGLMPTMNGGLMAGVNGGLMPTMNGGLMAGVNGGLANRAIPVMTIGGLNPPVVAAGGAGVIGQPQLAQFVLAVPAPIPNVYPVPAVNALPYMGVPQTAPLTLPQQPQAGITGGGVQQQLPLQPDTLRRFRRQTMKQNNSFKSTVDTQIPAPTETMTTTSCDKEGRPEDN
uniref:secretory calcium-binding phosphoprotein 9 n=1 Tax=Scatophagus argus TaxID=75038 RepID=UPI001ED7E3FB|nr:secretory calcium-binding phosphoprotein 9 [Scatophagus argus]